MECKRIFYIILLCAIVVSCSSPISGSQKENNKHETTIKEKLRSPFGTLLKMKVEIFDGDSINIKSYEGTFLFKIKSLEGIMIKDTPIMIFKDETGLFPKNNFELYKHLYSKESGSISSDVSNKMKKEYVGKIYNIVAYETGEFTGIPNGYLEYQPSRADKDFHFQNYLIVVANLTNNN